MSGNKGPAQQSKPAINPYESLRNAGQGADLPWPTEGFSQQGGHESTARKVANPEFTRVFDATNHRETYDRKEKISELQELLVAIRNEVTAVRAQNDELNTEMSKIEVATMQGLPENVGIYHIRFYELMLQYLRNVRTKIGEARTWLMASQAKQKAKRGSAFATRSKKQGSQFSQSMELQAARSVT